MTASSTTEANRSVLVTDFDGTMTARDYFDLVRERLLPPGTPDYWAEHKAGRLTHFEAMRAIFGAEPAGEAALIDLAHQAGLDPDLKAAVDALSQAGWEVVVVSAGCAWYIELLFDEAGVELPVLASPGRIEGGRLVMEWPADSPFRSETMGIDKAAVVRSFQDRGRSMAYAGNSLTDLEAALLVPGQRRFARESLADALRERGEPFRPFDRWSEVARDLAGGLSA